MLKLYNALPRLWLITKCLAIGYVAGSIHAPFGIVWRVDMEDILGLGTHVLPTEAMGEIDDEGIK